jgi:CheY-like chemotaxis protein
VILVADDSPHIRKLVGIALRSHGWVVHEAATTSAALALTAREHPDAVLLDVVFEGETDDGFDVCRKLRADRATADIPIIMLTARSTASDRERAGSVGVTAYLAKPFGVRDLINTLASVIGLTPSRTPLGLVLLDEGHVGPDDLELTLEEQRRLGASGIRVRLGDLLQRKGKVTAADVDQALARQQDTAASSAGGRPIRVVIADDHLSIRDGLRSLLADEYGIQLAGVALDGTEALRLLREQRPEVAILDQSMRGRTGLELLDIIKREGLPTKVVFFTLDAEIRERALAGGAAAFVSKDASARALVDAVRRAGRFAAAAGRPTIRTARLTAVRLARQALRARRAVALMGVLAVAYAGGFLVVEPLLGPAAAILSIAVVALAGSLLGPEAGVAAAILSAAENVVLWGATGHTAGETVLSAGGNGLGFLALLGIGAGFGTMRVLRGRFDRSGRAVDALVDAALLVSSARLDRDLLAEAASRMIDADVVLLYAPTSDGALEVAASTAGGRSLIGHRELGTAGAVPRTFREGRARALTEAEARSFIPRMRSGVTAPVRADADRPMGVFVALARARPGLSGADAATLGRLAPLVGLALKQSLANGVVDRTASHRGPAAQPN